MRMPVFGPAKLQQDLCVVVGNTVPSLLRGVPIPASSLAQNGYRGSCGEDVNADAARSATGFVIVGCKFQPQFL